MSFHPTPYSLLPTPYSQGDVARLLRNGMTPLKSYIYSASQKLNPLAFNQHF
ncbi:MAG: hypothetical protein F6K24_21205 [Okeania sp. SIO2D1]|nr:hypothetical protein [Okeania sp. SIO2D1]